MTAPLKLYVATYNETALAKFVEAGMRPVGRTLQYFEEDDVKATLFFRLYTRNLYGVLIGKADFSLYAPPSAPASHLGFHNKPNQMESKPGLAYGVGAPP